MKSRKIEKIVYDISFMRHFVALVPSWHSSQARRALNPCVLQNAYYKTRYHNIRIFIYMIINCGRFLRNSTLL
jgi:hypothetical protein